MELSKIESILKMDHLIVKEVSFIRHSDIDNFNNDINISINCNYKDMSTTKAAQKLVTFQTKVTNKANDFEVNIVVESLFKIELAESPDEELNAELFRANALSIIFPYVRSYITLLTTQPNCQPIVLPPINILSVFETQQCISTDNTSENEIH